MPSDEEIMIEKMKEWNDSHSGPAPLCEPPERREVKPRHAILPSIWKIEGSERLDEDKKEETWRDRPPML